MQEISSETTEMQPAPLSNAGWAWSSLALLITGVLLFLLWEQAPAGLLGKADAVGYAVCHRIEVRSFLIGERAFPLCARCTGTFVSVVVGLLYQAILAPRRGGMPPLRVWAALGGLAALWAADGLNSYVQLLPLGLGVYEPSNLLRLLTGSGMGLALSVAFYPAFNQTVWKDWQPKPAIPSLRALLPLGALVLGVDGLILTQNSLILYPLALISALGVLSVLTMVYAMVWLMVLRRENALTHPLQLILPLTGGFILAVLQIAATDYIRWLITGTWGGFHLG